MAVESGRVWMRRLLWTGVIALANVSSGSVSAAQVGSVARSDDSPAAPLVSVDMRNAPLPAILREIADQAGWVVMFNGAVVSPTMRGSLTVHSVPATVAFEHALRGTGLVANVRAEGSVTIVRAPVSTGGVITGRVIDGNTGKPLRDVYVTLDRSSSGVLTDESGGFRMANISAGEHVVHARRLGYGKSTVSVTVEDDQTVTADLTVRPTANMLGQVVVTGTVVATELKAIPNTITIITAKDIEERGITHLEQLFRGDVPGLFVQNGGSGSLMSNEVTMFSRGTTSLNQYNPSNFHFDAFTNPIKIYVDGVELANARYLTQLDPKNIERVEILTGPQASTIYGSNAINGVMQVFTKRGSTPQPQLTIDFLNGWVENNFRPTKTPQRDYSARISGAQGRISYNAGTSWTYMGPWAATKTSRLDASGGARWELSALGRPVTVDVTMRHDQSKADMFGRSDASMTNLIESGWYSITSAPGRAGPTTSNLTGLTQGVTLNFIPMHWWSHTIEVGQDFSTQEYRQNAAAFTSTSDTGLFISQNQFDRTSVRYTTTVQVPMTSIAQATVTVGGDGSKDHSSSFYSSGSSIRGYLQNVGASRDYGHNTGGFVQGQLGFVDHLFFTYGLRAEWNPNYGADAQPNLAPRYGIAYTQELGGVTAKLRGSYGRSTRPPSRGDRAARHASDAFGSSWTALSGYYDPFDSHEANVDLSPEHQQGGEGGLELYLGSQGSLAITRYNQTVDGLIYELKVDSVRSRTVCFNVPGCQASSTDLAGYGYQYQTEHLNVGSIRNQGWELRGSFPLGPFTTHGTYSWTKSRVLGITPKYRSLIQQTHDPRFNPGATFMYLAEHTWALGTAYARGATTVRLDVNGVGSLQNNMNELYVMHLYSLIRLQQNILNNSPQLYAINPGYATGSLSVIQRLTPRIDGSLHVENLANHYQNDFIALDATMGRQVKAGFTIRTQ